MRGMPEKIKRKKQDPRDAMEWFTAEVDDDDIPTGRWEPDSFYRLPLRGDHHIESDIYWKKGYLCVSPLGHIFKRRKFHGYFRQQCIFCQWRKKRGKQKSISFLRMKRGPHIGGYADFISISDLATVWYSKKALDILKQSLKFGSL